MRVRNAALAFVAMVALGCVKAPPKKKEEPPPPPPPTATESVQAVFAAAYKAIEAGDADGLLPLFTEDALVFGLGPGDTWGGGARVVDSVRQALLPIGLAGDGIAVNESRVVVGLSEDELAAWAFDLPKVRTVRRDQAETWLPRITAHLVTDGDTWKIDALHVSLAVPDQLVFAPDAAKRLLAPADVPPERTGDADQVMGLVRRALDDYAVKVARTSERAEFVQLGTSPSEVFIGGKQFKELLKPQLGAIKKAGYSWRLDGNLRMKIAPGGKSGWAAGIVVQRMGAGKKLQVFPAFRFLWIVVEENGLWNIASEHQSLAVREELREGATAEQLATWKATLELAEKAREAVVKPSKRSGKRGAAKEPAPKTDDDPGIGAW